MKITVGNICKMGLLSGLEPLDEVAMQHNHLPVFEFLQESGDHFSG
jgi:hypothetical protein